MKYRVSKLLKFHLFADDTSLLISHQEEHHVREEIANQELKQVNNSLSTNKLSLNVLKSHKILNFQYLCKLNLGKLQWDLHNGNYPVLLKITVQKV